jgi:hypothetical protein
MRHFYLLHTYWLTIYLFGSWCKIEIDFKFKKMIYTWQLFCNDGKLINFMKFRLVAGPGTFTNHNK